MEMERERGMEREGVTEREREKTPLGIKVFM
jgi:hypothetical protein